MHKLLRREEGFTLLELLIVIIIIGILALLILPNVTNGPKKARDTKRKTDLTTLQKSLEEYYLNYSIYPPDLSELSVGETPILSPIPTDPTNSGAFVYTYTPANSDTTYTLTACLEDNQASGVDIITPVSPCTTRTFMLLNHN